MRYGVALAVAVGLLIALPAAAREQAETRTVKVGQTVPLKTVFDKKRTYTIVMSGLVTLTLNDGGGKETYDPFHGAQAENCENAGPGSVYLQIEDKHGPAISASNAYKPPLYRVPCRLDHRYEFQVNDGPVVSDLDGKATAYIPLQPDPKYWTASGSFKLVIEAEPPEPVAVVIFGALANKKGLVASTRLTGRGLMETTEIKEGGLGDTARLLPRSDGAPEFRYADELRDRHLTVEVTSGELIMQGAPGSESERYSLRLIVEVVASNMRSCPAASNTRRGARGTLRLVDYPRGAPDTFFNTILDLPCGVDADWKSTDSNVGITVKRLKKK